VWCWDLETSESKSEMPGKFWSVVLEKDGEGQLDHCVKNEEVLHTVKEDMNVLHTLQIRNASWIGHILHRNCLLTDIADRKRGRRVEVTEVWGRRRKQLLNDVKEKRGYFKFKVQALDLILWRTRFARGYMWTCHKTVKWLNECRSRNPNVCLNQLRIFGCLLITKILCVVCL